MLTRKATADWNSLWLVFFSLWSAAFIPPEDAWDGWQTTRVRASLTGRQLGGCCRSVWERIRTSLPVWIGVCTGLLSVVLNKHIKCTLNYVGTTVDVPIVWYIYKEKPAAVHWGWWKMNPSITTTTPSGTGLQIRFAVRANPVKYGIIREGWDSSQSSLFLHTLQWTQLIDWLWLDI